jgi:unsaturated rhamnogalacturonyl hydrolase
MGPNRRQYFRILYMMLIVMTAHGAFAAEIPAPIAPLLRRVIDWQIALLPTQHIFSRDVPGGWVRAPFYDAVLAVNDVTGDPRDFERMTTIAEANHWDLLKRTRAESGLSGARSLQGDAAREPYYRFADDLALGQFYEAMWFHTRDDRAIAALRTRLDRIVAEPLIGREEWWWCDALYMAPPTFARLSAITKNRKYMDYADQQYWDVVDYLYSKDEHLFFRDKTSFTKKAVNGKPIFWSRGNGWVMAGLAHLLQAMPADYPTRPKYIALMNEMAEKIATLQQPDGFWRVSLLDPEEHTGKETSGTGFYCFAMAWGINNGVLPRDRYLPAVQKAWAALQTVVDPISGRVGWVQPVGSAPAEVKESDIAEYGTAAFLFAGVEVSKLK